MLNLGFVQVKNQLLTFILLIIMISIILFFVKQKITDSGNYQIKAKTMIYYSFLNKSIFLITILISFLSVLGFLEATLYLIKSIILTFKDLRKCLCFI